MLDLEIRKEISERVDAIQGKKFYMVKNSWGTESKYKGHWYASEAYVAYKTMNIVLHKDALPKTIQSKLGIK